MRARAFNFGTGAEVTHGSLNIIIFNRYYSKFKPIISVPPPPDDLYDTINKKACNDNKQNNASSIDLQQWI